MRKTNTNKMAAMNNANLNTKNFYSINVNNIPVGSKVTVLVDGKEMSMEDFLVNDPIAKQIEEEGFVRKTDLFRPWITAQTFEMLAYDEDGKRGWDAALNAMSYNYQFTMLSGELHELAGIQKDENYEYLRERLTFFNRDVIIATLKDYRKKLDEYISDKVYMVNRYRSYSDYVINPKICVEYMKLDGAKRIKKWVTASEARKTINKVDELISYINASVDNFKLIRDKFDKFILESYIKLPKDTSKCKVWRDAYKGSGAFYALKNMVMFHDVVLVDSNRTYAIAKEAAAYFLQKKREEYKGEGWRMHEYLKLIIDVNNFNLADSIRRQNVKKMLNK